MRLVLKELEFKDFRGGMSITSCTSCAAAFSVHVHFFTFHVLQEEFTDQELLSYSSGYINGDLLRTLRTHCIYSCWLICLPLVFHRSPSVLPC